MRHLQPRLVRQLLHRVHKRQPVGFHLKFDDIAMRAATKAVVETFAFVHGKRGGLFVMKRTKPLIFASFFG